MSSFRDELLNELTLICKQLYERRLELVKSQALVSENAKRDVIGLIVRLNRLRAITPFPKQEETDTSPLSNLKAELAASDSDQFAIQEKLMHWVNGFHPQIATADDGAVAPDDNKGSAVPPINQRMIDDLAAFRATIDRTRMKLLLNNDPADADDYTAARNAFTLARAVYDERLKLNQVTAKNADCARMEQILTPAVRDADGATFPVTIQAGADFISARLFV